MCACPFECLALSLANANFKGNRYLSNWDGKSFGIIGMREIKTPSPLAMPGIAICNRVPTRSLGTTRLRINSTGTPIFNLILLEGTPENSKELKDSTGYNVTCKYPLSYLQIDILL
ncbi:hypothetical protein AVEN_42090-1 [Araneus ventricosus]|uniref:Uncharacterized protein n=1 Tax=Araneus ventricosus TaxID=182803 RepID=A0A4Y2IL42_ARAVE|nr:hypothetical protein AVEN_42090-1 [Araneus ventricosus]